MGRALSEMRTPLERSVLFIATGAEEQGLLGAEWYVQSPLYPLEQTVAEFNFDGANLWGLTTDATIFGEERSELGAFARASAAQLDLTLMPDPEPQVGTFSGRTTFHLRKQVSRPYTASTAGLSPTILQAEVMRLDRITQQITITLHPTNLLKILCLTVQSSRACSAFSQSSKLLTTTGGQIGMKDKSSGQLESG